jgi:hypothetical protein
MAHALVLAMPVWESIKHAPEAHEAVRRLELWEDVRDQQLL